MLPSPKHCGGFELLASAGVYFSSSAPRVKIPVGTNCLKRERWYSSYDWPLASLGEDGPFHRLLEPVGLAPLEAGRRVICSITSSGLEMPPVQNAFQIWSTWLLMAPVIIQPF
jgi:hypothetical protein